MGLLVDTNTYKEMKYLQSIYIKLIEDNRYIVGELNRIRNKIAKDRFISQGLYPCVYALYPELSLYKFHSPARLMQQTKDFSHIAPEAIGLKAVVKEYSERMQCYKKRCDIFINNKSLPKLLLRLSGNTTFQGLKTKSNLIGNTLINIC